MDAQSSEENATDGQADMASDPKQEYIYFIGSKTTLSLLLTNIITPSARILWLRGKQFKPT